MSSDQVKSAHALLRAKMLKGLPKLHLAAAMGDQEAAQRALDGGWFRKPADINACQDDRYHPPLFYAVTEGMTEMVRFLLSNGANTICYETDYASIDLRTLTNDEEIKQLLEDATSREI